MGAFCSAQSGSIHEGIRPFAVESDVTDGGATRYSVRFTTAARRSELPAETISLSCSISNVSLRRYRGHNRYGSIGEQDPNRVPPRGSMDNVQTGGKNRQREPTSVAIVRRYLTWSVHFQRMAAVIMHLDAFKVEMTLGSLRRSLKSQEGHCRVLGAARDFAGARALGNTEQQVDHPITPQ